MESGGKDFSHRGAAFDVQGLHHEGEMNIIVVLYVLRLCLRGSSQIWPGFDIETFTIEIHPAGPALSTSGRSTSISRVL